jgi:hypothetical protein
MENPQNIIINDLIKACQRIPDPRKRLGRRHPLASILALMVLAILCGANDNKSIIKWGKSNPRICDLLGFRQSKPLSEATLCRICKILPATWYDLIITFYREIELQGKQICLDGKRTKGKKAAQQLTVTAFVAETHIVVGVKDTIFGKEIPAVKELIDELNIKGAIITTDALSTQRDLVKKQ